MGIADKMDAWDAYLEKWVYGVASEDEMLEKLVGMSKLRELMQRATIKEGYRA